MTSPDTFPHPRVSAPPPYIRMFHENGDMRDCDPLPLYSVQAPEDEDVEMVEALTAPPEPVRRPQTPLDPAPSAAAATASPQRASLEAYDTEANYTETTPSPSPSPSASPERPSSGSSTHSTRPARSRSAADDLSPASRKLFEQWAREGSASAEGEGEGVGMGEGVLSSSLP